MGNGCSVRKFTFYAFSEKTSFSEAFFESMSGITTTGATIISDLDNSPKKYSSVEINYAMVGRYRIVVMAQ